MLMIFVPYVFLVVLYLFAFGVYKPRPPNGSLLSAFFKCLPIVYLLLLVLAAARVSPQHENYKFYVSIGLFLSIGGDWFFNWTSTHDSAFFPGIGFFALAQISYICAFGFDRMGGQTAFLFSIAGLCMMSVLLPDVKPRGLRPFVGVYLVLLGVMGWRATVLYKVSGNFEDWVAMVGAVNFIMSDFVIAYSRWKTHLSKAELLIMVTYYIAQASFALSVLMPSWQALKRFEAMGV